jgi:hypothetical protein
LTFRRKKPSSWTARNLRHWCALTTLDIPEAKAFFSPFSARIVAPVAEFDHLQLENLMANPSDHASRFTTLSDFLSQPEELATVEELAAVGPWKTSQLRFWLYEADRNGLEAALVRPNQRRLFIHSGRFKKWLDERTAAVRRERELTAAG